MRQRIELALQADIEMRASRKADICLVFLPSPRRRTFLFIHTTAPRHLTALAPVVVFRAIDSRPTPACG
jgi:hypothetical protein